MRAVRIATAAAVVMIQPIMVMVMVKQIHWMNVKNILAQKIYMKFYHLKRPALPTTVCVPVPIPVHLLLTKMNRFLF